MPHWSALPHELHLHIWALRCYATCAPRAAVRLQAAWRAHRTRTLLARYRLVRTYRPFRAVAHNRHPTTYLAHARM